MTTTTVDEVLVNDTRVRRCPLCGHLLDPDWDGALCPICELDEAEKWADYVAEQQQARHPY